MFPQNLTYLLDNNFISVETILKITKHKSSGLVSMWKSGERQIKTPDIMKIAGFLGYSIDDLLNKDIITIKPMVTHTIIDNEDVKLEIKLPHGVELTNEMINQALDELYKIKLKHNK